MVERVSRVRFVAWQLPDDLLAIDKAGAACQRFDQAVAMGEEGESDREVGGGGIGTVDD